MLKKGIILISVLMISLFSCTDKVEKYAEINDQEIRDYLEENGLDAIKHESGLYYIIHNEGTGENPVVFSNITFKFTAWLLDGTQFDQTPGDDPKRLPLYGLIEGWQIGVPLIKEGGTITLYIPSRLGYGSQDRPNTPPYSALIYEIELIEVENL